MSTCLEDVRALLGFDDTKRDALLSTIIRLTEGRLQSLLNVTETPSELDFIVTEVSVARFNKIGSEGAVAHSAGSESLSFSDSSDFKNYMPEIEAWKEAHTETGTVRFI